MTSIQNLYSFANKIAQQAKGISILELDVKVLDLLIKDSSKKIEQIRQETIEELKSEYGVVLDEEQANFSLLTSCRLSWKRPEKKEEGYLDGGFLFNGLSEIYSEEFEFWKKSEREFKEIEDEKKFDDNLIKQLRWIESPTNPTEAEYTPQFGCVKLKKGKLPDQFYFYDSGLVFPLPFRTLDEYVDALVASGSVTCWQYFYVDPELIINQNRGLKYITWSKHTTSQLGGGIESIHYKPEIKSDRLDLINEYLDRCVKLLPKSFPFLDFGYHENYFSKFQMLYKKKRN